MRDKPVDFKSTAQGGGAIQARVIAGFANFCEFRVTLWNPDGKNPSVLTHQTNADSTPDVVTVSEHADSANGCIIGYEAKIAAHSGGPTQYSFIVEFWQDGQPLADPVTETGPLNGGTFLFGGVRLMGH